MGSKGIALELFQDYVCKLRTWRVRVYGKEFQLQIESASAEWPVHDLNGSRTTSQKDTKNGTMKDLLKLEAFSLYGGDWVIE